MGMGTVLVFGALQHTAYPCHGVAGTHGFIVISLSSIFLHFKLRFVLLFSFSFYSNQGANKREGACTRSGNGTNTSTSGNSSGGSSSSRTAAAAATAPAPAGQQ
jgi:hypothetical protein